MGYIKLVFFMLFPFLCQLAFSSSLSHLCPNDQAHALLQFKHMFTINAYANYESVSSNLRTLSWNESIDCCSWDGVYCDEATGQVIELNLTCSGLQGEFHSNSSLFQLSNLKRLDLSMNDFSESLISPKFGGFSSMTHLDLSRSYFSGQIPYEISHLSKLHLLRISTYAPYELTLRPHNFELLLKNMTQLIELELYHVNISSTIPLNFSSYITLLHLGNTQLRGILPERVLHLSNLESLDLLDNPQLTVRFPMTKWNSSASLVELYLGGSDLTGTIPESFSHLTSLRVLRITSANLSGYIPKSLWNLTNIEDLDLGHNHIEGSISDFFRFGKLRSIYLRYNNFDGQLDFLSFNGWTQLEQLDFSFNSLTGLIPSNVNGMQNLQSLSMSSNSLNGTIPSWMFSLPSLIDLDLSDNHFSGNVQEFKSVTGPIPSNVNGLQNLQSLRLSSNYLNGTIPSWIFSLPSLTGLDLSNNHFSGNIQEFKSQTLNEVVLKQNQLQGPIPKSLLNQRELYYLLLSRNNLSGQITSTICNVEELSILDLGSNNLEGTIPLCLGEISGLRILDLSDNSLSGTINTIFSIRNPLGVIKLHGNKLEGKVPQSLINCRYLEVLDLGNNELNGTFPKWLGTLQNLKILSLRSNKLHGPIKVSKNQNLFDQLQIIDVSSNEFSGNLPTSLFENFQAMRIADQNLTTPGYVGDTLIIYASPVKTRHVRGHNSIYEYVIAITTKGRDLESVRVFPKNIIINLSNNRFEGYIPSIVGDLVGLHTMNLSHNLLEGHIPASLQHLSVLESLDLSSNKIGGGIPQQLASLTFLAVLNLSHNHLVGCIPKGKQFDTFERSSYQGNDGLRGFPLSKDCGGGDGVSQMTTPAELDQGEGEDSTMISWQAVLMGYGCGLIVVLSLIYIMLTTQYPAWFSRMVEELEQKIITRIQKHKKRK